SYRSQMLSLLNQDRANNGLAPVAMDETMNTVAQYHAQDMSDQQYFDHINLDGWTPWKRMDYFGVTYFAAGENIAVGQDSPGEVETAWMNSTGHRANILNESFGKVGLGIVPTSPGDTYAPGYYWVQVFTN
ncbi:MAG: CAP domain-containing protein, partial [bacterium]|nr:CAP domain-containing protein [bacterium]